jgi:tetratricopeptide (TPR) repeat protein
VDRAEAGAGLVSDPSETAQTPDETPAQALLDAAIALHKQGQLQPAAAAYQEVLRLDTANAGALHGLGLVAQQTGQFDLAVDLISQAIAIDPHVAGMYANRGLALGALGRLEEAAADHARATALAPGLAPAHFNLAGALRSLGRLEEALQSYDRALALQPRPDAHTDRGAVLEALGRLDEAVAAYDRALALAPGQLAAWFNRGNALKKLKRLAPAIASYERAIALAPDFAMAHYNLAVCLLLEERFERGLAEYEWRKRAPDFSDNRVLPGPALSPGDDLQGKTLFIYPELFLGDVIQFGRYARLAEQRGAKVVLAAPAALHALLRTLGPGIELVARDAEPAGFDYHCALLSLPLAFGTTPETIPAEVPYLRADPARAQTWRRRLGGDGFKVGVCWQGSTQAYAAPMQRSFPLAELRGIARIPGLRLISLQKRDGLDQLEALPAGMAVETLGEDFDAGPDAFLDAAAVMASCDLVISADTATAHLAGALGVPTWIALPFVPDWRWLLDRSDSPWYPSVRLFRQGSQGDWAGVFADMAAALAAEAARRWT